MSWASRMVAAVALATAAATQALAGDYLSPSAVPAMTERVQLVYDAQSRTVNRRLVRVWSPSPEKNLDFVWEPRAGAVNDGLREDGTIDGAGRLVWRVRGSASYDPATIFSTFEGELRDGRPHGRGRLELRSGEFLEGEWRNGLPNGEGAWLDARGDRYEGTFRDGRPEGQGRLMSRTGAIYTGPFVAGLRDGEGTTRLPGGATYRSTWRRGIELGTVPPHARADARVGGLLKAQEAGSEASRLEIGVSIEERMNQRSEMRYQQLVRDEDIAIYPASPALNDFWNGTGEIPTGTYALSGIDWENAPAFVDVDLETTDGSRATLDRLELKVEASDYYRKPMLTLKEHSGCVGFRPTFSLLNHGWGDVRNARMSFRFMAEGDAADAPASREFSVEIGDFDPGKDVSIRDTFVEAGVGTQKLETKRYSCPSLDSLNVCRSQVFNDVDFGEIADFVTGDVHLSTTLVGKLDYDWADDAGNLYHQSESVRAAIALVTIEMEEGLAECGDAFGGSPEALRFQDVPLRLGERDYAVEMRLRGNRSVSSYTARLKMHAPASSFHRMRVAATMGDGSVRESKPVSLFYFRPREVNFTSTATPPACYLGGLGASC
jgi:hypothetical protein